MKNAIFTFFLAGSLLFSGITNASHWTWIGGTNGLNDIANYGTIGTEVASNKPGSRREFVTWKDANGGLWMFGGYGRAAASTLGHLSDLWKFNPANNQWTWVKGPNIRNQLGTYGTQGTPSPTNLPGSRRWASGWADNAGNLWLFGGFGYSAAGSTGRLNDLWKYNTLTNEWTWVSGSNTTNQTGDYVTAGSLRPGGRSKVASWTDGTNGWIFGGDGYTSTSLGQLNDLWRYNTTTNTWTFLKGDDATSTSGVYGGIGVSNPANKPGSREMSTAWYTAGELFLFGGGNNSTQLYGDLWKYNIGTNEWTWIKGPSVLNSPGNYGTILTIDSLRYPGSRQLAPVFRDLQGRIFIVGGYGYASSGNGNLNDVWCYKPTDNTWTWIKGSNAPDAVASNGTLNVTASSNQVSARSSSGGWTDANGNAILFGGFGVYSSSVTGYMNDVWRFNSSTALPINLLTFNAQQVDKNIELSWATGREWNNDYFEILHSSDGQHFNVLDKVSSYGNSNVKQEYSSMHINPNLNATHYYRLRQVDIDGKNTTSEVITWIPQSTQDFDFQTTVLGSGELRLNTSAKKVWNAYIYDMNGKMVAQLNNVNTPSTTINLAHLPKGMYIIQAQYMNQMKSGKVLLR